jgi:Co/Zn/Cd efflux system component
MAWKVEEDAAWMAERDGSFPMLIVAVVGSLVNLYVLWRIRSLRSRPSSQWRIQPPTTKQLRSERFQSVLSVLTLVLVVMESAIHHHLHGAL